MIFETWTHDSGHRRILVTCADTAESPRAYSIGTFLGLPNRKHVFGDVQQKAGATHTPIEALQARINSLARRGGKAFAIWCYEHDGLSFSVTDLPLAKRPAGADVFDSYPAGAFLVEPEHAGNESLLEIVKGEISQYAAWVNGEIYQIVLETATTCQTCGKTEWNEQDVTFVYGIENTGPAAAQLGEFALDNPKTNGWNYQT